MRILLIEDDQSINGALANVLRTNNIVCDTANSAESGIAACRANDYDLVLLDLVLPDQDGFDTIKILRNDIATTAPILVLSGLPSVDDRVQCLNLGADDYLKKPFHKRELLARIHAILRRSSSTTSSVIKIGRLHIDLSKQCVKSDTGKALELTEKEYRIVELMARRMGSVVTKSCFIDHLYSGSEEPEFKIIDVFICKIRNKIKALFGNGVEYIHTAWGRGYVMEYRPETHTSIQDAYAVYSPLQPDEDSMLKKSA